MKFRVVLTNNHAKSFQCPSNIGIMQLLGRFGLKSKVKYIECIEPDLDIDITIDEDGNVTSQNQLYKIEDWAEV